MANWDHVLPYDEQVWEWLESECYPHPAVQPGNRLPSSGDVKWALSGAGIPANAFLVIDDNFDWNNNAFIPKALRMRGESLLELRLLTKLSERCGQLLLYPDSGEVAVVVDRSLDPQLVASLREDLSSAENGWRRFFAQLYAPPCHPSWCSADVIALAQAIEDSQGFDRLLVLADALEEVGCNNEMVLAHCRGPGPHVHDCWVVDLLLRKG